MKSTERIRAVGAEVIALCSIFATAACGADPGSEHDSTSGVLREKLWMPTGTQPVPGGVLQVCFWPIIRTAVGPPETFANGNLTDPNFLSAKASIQSLLENYYETTAGVKIDFQGWANCPSGVQGSFTGGLRFTIETDFVNKGAGYRFCSVGSTYVQNGCTNADGYTATQEMNIYIGLPGDSYNAAQWPVAVLHETAHALGFDHEYRRTDADGCNGSGYLAGFFLTPYDHDSIGNGTYCHWNIGLSRLDQLGLNIVYPKDGYLEPVVGRAGFVLGASTLLVRNDDTLMTNWLRLGAFGAAFYGGTRYANWQIDGGSLFTSTDANPFLASNLGDGHQVTGLFTDYQNRDRYIASTTVRVHNGLHTAVVMSTMSTIF